LRPTSRRCPSCSTAGHATANGPPAEVYPALFAAELRECIAEAEPAQEESHFLVYGGSYLLCFRKTAGGCRLHDPLAARGAPE